MLAARRRPGDLDPHPRPRALSQRPLAPSAQRRGRRPERSGGQAARPCWTRLRQASRHRGGRAQRRRLHRTVASRGAVVGTVRELR